MEFFSSWAGSHESLFWATPLTEDKLTTFYTWKRAGVPLQRCDYIIEGTNYSFEANQCIMTTDMYRGHHTYGMAFHFGLAQGFTQDGKSFGLVMQEGIGAKYTGKDRATEDHININGEVFKLDQISMDVQEDQKRSEATGSRQITVNFKTIADETAVFPERVCEGTFTSDALRQEGINLVLLAQKRDYWLGKFDLNCTIDGQKIN